MFLVQFIANNYKGPSINDVGGFEGKGVQIDDMGRYDVGRGKKSTISAIKDCRFGFFFSKTNMFAE